MFASSNTRFLFAVGFIIMKTYLAGDTPVLKAMVGLREVSGVWTETSGSSNFRTEFCAKSSNVSVPSSTFLEIPQLEIGFSDFGSAIIYEEDKSSGCPVFACAVYHFALNGPGEERGHQGYSEVSEDELPPFGCGHRYGRGRLLRVCNSRDEQGESGQSGGNCDSVGHPHHHAASIYHSENHARRATTPKAIVIRSE